MENKIYKTFLNIIPLVLMIGLIPFISNDYILTFLYILIIFISFCIKKESKEVKLFFLGFLIMIISELIFTSTKVEIFERNSLLGYMPLWLPFLWGYGFVVIKRFIKLFSF